MQSCGALSLEHVMLLHVAASCVVPHLTLAACIRALVRLCALQLVLQFVLQLVLQLVLQRVLQRTRLVVMYYCRVHSRLVAEHARA